VARGEKTLVFSESTQSLVSIQAALEKRFGWVQGLKPGASFLRLEGKTAAVARTKIIDKFNNSPTMKVFLVSVVAGGVGINLTSASRVIVYDAPWNPTHNEQAIARAYRIGQKREVLVYRLVTDQWLESQKNSSAVTKTQLADRVVEQRATKQTIEMAHIAGARRGLPEEGGAPDQAANAAYAVSCGDPVMAGVLAADARRAYPWIRSTESYTDALEEDLAQRLNSAQAIEACEEFLEGRGGGGDGAGGGAGGDGTGDMGGERGGQQPEMPHQQEARKRPGRRVDRLQFAAFWLSCISQL
jgi:hypothetical protein